MADGVNRTTLTSVCVGLVEELCACVQVSKCSDAQTVGGVKLRLQEFTTNLTNIIQLKETGCWQENLKIKRKRLYGNLLHVKNKKRYLK